MYHSIVSGDQFRHRINVRALFVRLTGLPAHAPLPDALTLAYLDGSESKVKSFADLRRVVPAEPKSGEAIFGTRERVLAVDGLGFEVYVAEQRAVKGIFRKREGQNWKLDCTCVLDSEIACFGSAAEEAEVCVAAEGHAALIDRVVLAAVKRKRELGFAPLETIPEEGEDECGSDGCCCLGGEWECVSDGGDSEEWCDVDGDEVGLEMAMEGVSWAVDVGLCVMCLGVGFMVSKSSAQTLRRLRLL